MLVSDFVAAYPPEPGCMAVPFLAGHNTIEEAWPVCPDPMWMLWCVSKTQPDIARFMRVRMMLQSLILLGEATPVEIELGTNSDNGTLSNADFIAAMIPSSRRVFEAHRRHLDAEGGKMAIANFTRTRFTPFAA